MKTNDKKIEFTAPKLINLDDENRIAGAVECTSGSADSGYCSTGSGASGSGCNTGSSAACTSGHF